MTQPSYVVLFGTRPELTKLAPLIPLIRCRVWHSGQHQALVNQTADTPDLRIILSNLWRIGLKPESDPISFATTVRRRVHKMLVQLPDKPHALIVQGDTSTAYGGALGARDARIPVYHIEAGIRSHNLDDPYPEERFRVAIDGLASLHFAPTQQNKENLLNEGVRPDQIFVTGNTGLDLMPAPAKPTNTVLITLHRRETLDHLPAIAQSLDTVAKDFPHITFLWPAHLNPKVQSAARNLFHVKLSPPLGNQQFRDQLRKAQLVITDSGGVQEEASYLGVTTLIARNTTDRPESVSDGNAWLGSTNPQALSTRLRSLLAITPTRTPSTTYGDGTASLQISQILNNP